MAKQFKNFRDESRVNWGRELSDGEKMTRGDIQHGAILRIADAIEKMAERYTALIDEREWLRRKYRAELAKNERLKRSNAGLRATITRMKRK